MNYDIRPFHPGHLDQVVECLSPLWGNNFQENLSTFKWKHIENSYVEEPLGTVAMYGGQVVGFRGFLATRWQVPRTHHQFTLLSPCDTCVNPRVQKRGLSVAMGHFAMRQYQAQYKVFLNTSASPHSFPGYLRMGFIGLATKISLYRHDWLNLLWRKSFWSQEQRAAFYVKNLKYGLFGQVSVEREARPDAMAAIVEKQNRDGNRISLLQDSIFFGWRFNNSVKRYVFYYFKESDSIRAYVVVGVAKHPSLGIIVDYAEEPGINAFETILLHIIREGHFGRLSIPGAKLEANALDRLHRLKFRSEPAVLRRWRGKADIPPFLVRPVREDCDESDWFLGGLDIRKPENWEIKGISNDAI